MIEYRMHGRRKHDGKSHILFALTMAVILGAGFFGFKLGLLNGSSEDLMTGSTIREYISSPALEQWKTLSDKSFTLESYKAFMAFGQGEGDSIIRYSIKSDYEVKVYWIRGEKDCKAIIDGKEKFYDYESCEPDDPVKVFRSGECKVPSDSGICIIHDNSEPTEISLKIENKL